MLQQLCDEISNNFLIENNGVSPEWSCNPFSSDPIVTACKQSLGKGNVFTPVYHSVQGRGVDFPACITGHMTRVVCLGAGGLCLHRGLHLGAPFRGVCLPGVGIQGSLPPGGLGRPPPQRTTGCGQQTDILVFNKNSIRRQTLIYTDKKVHGWFWISCNH